MHRPALAALLVGLHAALLACGSPSGGLGATGRFTDDDRRLFARYPDDAYIAEPGYSRADVQEARANAVANVCKRVDAQVSSELSILSSAANGRDQQQVLSFLRQSSRFEHAHLIRVLPESVACADQGCRALAVLDRRAATAYLDPLADEASRRFGQAAATALQHAPDLPSFSQALRHAERAYRELTSLSLQIAAIRGVTAPRASSDAPGLFDALSAERDARLSNVRVLLRADDVQPPDLWNSLSPALTNALGELGLSVGSAGDGHAAWQLDVRAALKCEQSYLGPRCVLEGGAVLRQGSGAAELARLDLAGLKAAGAHPNSFKSARERALAELRPDALTAVLREQLWNVLPVR